MEVGNLKQKASPYIVYFVFGCIIIIIGLLFVMQKSELLAESISYGSSIDQDAN